MWKFLGNFMNDLPPLFLARLEKILPFEHYETVKKTFTTERPLTVRINTLKTQEENVLEQLRREHMDVTPLPWYRQALMIKNSTARDFAEHELIKTGQLYIQSLSSMLPALVLDPRPGDAVLDLCAAPGSKTTQMAALLKNQGTITAVEPIRARYYKLRSVVEQLGAQNVHLKMMDGRRFENIRKFPKKITQKFQRNKNFSSPKLFDKILVDAPCSSEGRFKTFHEESFAYWSPRKIKEMVRKQRGLLLNASRLLKPGGVLVYSTCTFAPEENEGVIDWLLKKTPGTIQLIPIEFPEIIRYSAISAWGKKFFHKDIQNCFRVLPAERMEGFFVAKLVKVFSHQPSVFSQRFN